MSWMSDLFGKEVTETKSTSDIRQLPDYSEASGAREEWWETLQEWGDMPGYGAIAPNWDEMWTNAADKVSRYFQGGPEGPGLEAKMKSNLAGRGQSEQPAAETMLSRVGMHQGNLLQDMAIKQAIQEAQFSEKGRQNWMGQLMQLSGQKPGFTSYGSTGESSTGGGEGWDILGAAAGGMTGMGGSNVIGGSQPANIGGVSKPKLSGSMGGYDWYDDASYYSGY